MVEATVGEEEVKELVMEEEADRRMVEAAAVAVAVDLLHICCNNTGLVDNSQLLVAAAEAPVAWAEVTVALAGKQSVAVVAGAARATVEPSAVALELFLCIDANLNCVF